MRYKGTQVIRNLIKMAVLKLVNNTGLRSEKSWSILQ
jgi:hypothetical protein